MATFTSRNPAPNTVVWHETVGQAERWLWHAVKSFRVGHDSLRNFIGVE